MRVKLDAPRCQSHSKIRESGRTVVIASRWQRQVAVTHRSHS